jgi:hypothetical protein
LKGSRTRGRILGRNGDKSIKSFLPAFHSHLSLTSTNRLRKPQVWELSRLCQETSAKMYVQEFGFRFNCWFWPIYLLPGSGSAFPIRIRIRIRIHKTWYNKLLTCHRHCPSPPSWPASSS